MLGPIVVPAVVALIVGAWWLIRMIRFAAARRREGDRLAREHARQVHPSNRPMLPKDMIAADIAYREEQDRLRAIAEGLNL